MPSPTEVANILHQIRKIESQLSPENLFCDGERSKTEARKIERILNKELRALVSALGRQPTLTELYA